MSESDLSYYYIHDDVGWPGLVNQFLKRYLTDYVFGEAYDAVATARQQPHKTETTFADPLETAAFWCTAVFSEQSLAYYFARGVSLATRAAVSDAVQRLPGCQKIIILTICLSATAEGTTCRARRGFPLPDPKSAEKEGPTTKSTATSSPASALHIGEDEWQAKPVLITQGSVPGGERPPTPVSPGTTGSYATAFEHTPGVASVTDPWVAELDISN